MIDFIHIAKAAGEIAGESGAHESSGAIGTLGLNLKLFIAQLINFGIILAVLWKWVFTPVAKKLTERTEKIEKAMRDAEGTEKEKLEFGLWKESEMIIVKGQASTIIASAETEAIKAKEKIIQDTKAEQEKVIQQAKVQIEQEKNQQLQLAKSELADLVTLATEKILRQKLDDKKDEKIIKESLKGI